MVCSGFSSLVLMRRVRGGAARFFFSCEGGWKKFASSRRKSFFEKVAVDLRVHVIEIRFDDRNFFVEACDNVVGSFADHDANDVWLPFELDRTCAITDRGNGHLRLWTERVAQRRNYCCASGRCPLTSKALDLRTLREWPKGCGDWFTPR